MDSQSILELHGGNSGARSQKLELPTPKWSALGQLDLLVPIIFNITNSIKHAQILPVQYMKNDDIASTFTHPFQWPRQPTLRKSKTPSRHHSQSAHLFL
jgi:hypothetical protein